MAFWDGSETRRILRSGGEVYALQDRLAPVSGGVVVELSDMPFALGFLRRFSDDPRSAEALRDMLADELTGAPLDDEEVIEALAWRVASGRLRVLRLPTEPLFAVGEGEVAEEPVPEGRRVKDWIEIVLVDEDDKPVAGAAYEITLPDGSTLTGQTSIAGRIRLSDIDPGVCAFSFTKLDERVWSAA